MSWFGFGRKKKKPEAEPATEPGPEAEADAPVETPAQTDEPADIPPTDDAKPEAEASETPFTDDRALDVAQDTSPAQPDAIEPPAEPPAPVDPAPSEEPVEGETEDERAGFFSRLASGLKKSSSKLSGSIASVFTKRKLDDAALEELEDLLVAADLGAQTAAKVIARLARERFGSDVTDVEIREAVADVVAETLQPCEAPLDLSGPAPQVVLFVGVNGSGKTTTLGKLAVKMTREGAGVVTAAGDTFRAAAVEQLEVWSKRAGATFLSREIGADAAGLAWDAVDRARRDGAEAVLIDTAGRLQNKAELMDELRKIVRVIGKLDETAPHHVVLVLDGTVGSNAISQAEAFMEAANVTGVVMTKLDGTAKGGALVQVAQRFNLPIHFIGVGEGEADLQPFNARAFARALAGLETESA